MKSLPGTSSVHVKTAITPNFCTGTWACWTIRYCSRHSSVRCSALSVTCNSRMHFIEFDSNKLWCKFNTAEWKARVENPDHHKAISFDCTLPFQSAPSSFLLESNKDQNVWNYVLRIVFGGSSNAYGPRQLDDPWRPVPFAPTLRRCFPVPASGWFIWLERCIQRKSFAQTNKVFSDKMTRNDRNTSGHVIHTMAFIANNDKFTRCWLYHLECTHHITEIMKKYIWKLCLGSLSIQRRAVTNKMISFDNCLVHFETTCCIWETFTVKNVPTTNHIFSYICRWSQKRYMYHVFYVRIESCDLVHFICYP